MFCDKSKQSDIYVCKVRSRKCPPVVRLCLRICVPVGCGWPTECFLARPALPREWNYKLSITQLYAADHPDMDVAGLKFTTSWSAGWSDSWTPVAKGRRGTEVLGPCKPGPRSVGMRLPRVLQRLQCSQHMNQQHDATQTWARDQ